MKYQVSQRMKEQFVGLDQRKDSQPSRKFPHLKITYSWRALKVLSVLTKEDEIIPRLPSFRTQVRWCTLLLCLNSHCMSSSLCILQGLSHTSIEGKAQECLQLDERQQDLWTAAFSTQPTIPRILNSLTDKFVDSTSVWLRGLSPAPRTPCHLHSLNQTFWQPIEWHLFILLFFSITITSPYPITWDGETWWNMSPVGEIWEKFHAFSTEDDKGLRSQVSLAGMLEATQNSTPSTT